MSEAWPIATWSRQAEALEETGQKWQYGYDGLKQLVTAKKTDTATSVVPPLDQSYSYDPMGNRRAYTEQGKSVAYAANSANQYTSISESGSNGASSSPLPAASSLAYDRNGNLLTDGLRTYTWDAENQLVAVTPVNPTEGSQRVEYTYDWRMRRKDKKSFIFANGAWALARTHTFKYHEWNPIEETISTVASINSQPSTVTSTKSYVWGNDLSGNLHGAGGVGGLLSMRIAGSAGGSPAASGNYFYAYDGNGNVRALVKADSANPAASGVAEKYAYDGFGRELQGTTPASASVNSFRFSTKQLDGETGMNYYGRRFYAADSGRWINRDPIMEEGGLNLFNFAKQDSINNIDKLGNLTLTVTVEIEYEWIGYAFRTFNGGLKLFQQVEYSENMSEGCKVINNYVYTGETVEYNRAYLPEKKVEIARAHTTGGASASSSADKNDCKCTFSLAGNASNPLVSGAPAIDYSGSVEIDFKSKTYKAKFSHDGFPSYTFSGIGNGYNYSHVAEGTDPGSLFPPMEKKWSDSGTY